VAGVVPALVALWALLSEEPYEAPHQVQKQASPMHSAQPSGGVPGACDELPSATPSSVEIALEPPVSLAPTRESAAETTSADPPSPTTPPCPSGASSLATMAPAPAAVQIVGERSQAEALRALVFSAEYSVVLLMYAAQGVFQGSFFSLMPVVIADEITHSLAEAEGAAGNATAHSTTGSAQSAPIIAAFIIASGALQILSNFLLVRPSLRRFGSHGHLAWLGTLGTILLAATAIHVAVHLAAAEDSRLESSAFIGIYGTLFTLSYICSATCLTVLNQIGAAYARAFGAPVGTVTGISRSIFAASFGIAPAGSIALNDAVPWLPLVLMAAFNLIPSCGFSAMKLAQWTDPVPPAGRACYLPAT
jgi:hypothetical protein